MSLSLVIMMEAGLMLSEFITNFQYCHFSYIAHVVVRIELSYLGYGNTVVAYCPPGSDIWVRIPSLSQVRKLVVTNHYPAFYIAEL